MEKIRLIINSVLKSMFFGMRHHVTLESDNLVGCPTNNHVFILNPQAFCKITQVKCNILLSSFRNNCRFTCCSSVSGLSVCERQLVSFRMRNENYLETRLN